METSSPFFGNSVDREDDLLYPEAFIRGPGGFTSIGDALGYANTFDADAVAISVSSSTFPGSQTTLSFSETLDLALQDGTDGNFDNNPASYCDPVIIGDVNITQASPPSTISSTSNDKSSTTRPSLNSSRSIKTNSTSASSNAPGPLEPPQKRRGRKAKLPTNEGGEEEKRNIFLEKNRVAASKCRQKKKEFVSDLEETREGLEHQNSYLQQEYHGLLGEVSRMKSQLMLHANCQDPIIDKWIQNEARKFVEGQNSQIIQNMFGDGSPHMRRFSTTSSIPVSGVGRPRRYTPTSSHQEYSDTSSLQASPDAGSFDPIPAAKVKKEPSMAFTDTPDDMYA